MPSPAVGGRPYFQGVDVVRVVMHGFPHRPLPLTHLLHETFLPGLSASFNSEAIGNFAAHHEQLEAVGDVRVMVVAARPARDFRRIVDDESGIPQQVLVVSSKKDN